MSNGKSNPTELTNEDLDHTSSSGGRGVRDAVAEIRAENERQLKHKLSLQAQFAGRVPDKLAEMKAKAGKL